MTVSHTPTRDLGAFAQVLTDTLRAAAEFPITDAQNMDAVNIRALCRLMLETAKPVAPSATTCRDAARFNWLIRKLDEDALFRVLPQAADLNGIFTFEAIRKHIDAALNAAAETVAAPQDVWIPWNGGPAPVGKKDFVEVKFRDGSTHYDCDWIWAHNQQEDDIVAYRRSGGQS